MREDKFSRANIILYLLGLLPTVWLGLLVAPAIDLEPPNLITNLAAVFGNPFHIVWCEDSLKTVLVFICAYVIGIIVYVYRNHTFDGKTAPVPACRFEISADRRA